MKCAIFWMVFSFIFLNNLFSQPSDKVIDIKNFDNKLLEYFTKQQLDSFRFNHRLGVLNNDPVLYRAADDQAQYLINATQLSHYQKAKNKKFPADRIKFYGGNFLMTAENIESFFNSFDLQNLNSLIPTSIKTYRGLAIELFRLLKSNKGFMANSLTKQFNLVGLAMVFDLSSNQLIVVHEFAKSVFNYKVVFNLELFPYDSKFSAFKLKSVWFHTKHAYHVQNCTDQSVLTQYSGYKKKRNGASRLYRCSDTLVFTHGYLDEAKSFFRGPYDGMMYEIVPDYFFSCDTNIFKHRPNRLNGDCIFNGFVQKPVYKITSLYFPPKCGLVKDPDNKRKYFTVSLGRVNHHFGSSEENIIILKNNKIVDIIYPKDETFLPWDFHGKFLLKLDNPYNNSDVYHPEIFNDTARFKFSYQVLQVDPTCGFKDSLIHFISDSNKVVRKIYIRCFTSLEGYDSINNRLIKSRAEALIKILKPYCDEKNIVVSSNLNWELFKKQAVFIEKNVNTDELEDLVNDITEPDTVEQFRNLFNQQRFCTIQIIYQPVKTTEELCAIAYQKLIERIKSIRKAYDNDPEYKISPKKMNFLKSVQAFLLKNCNDRCDSLIWNIPQIIVVKDNKPGIDLLWELTLIRKKFKIFKELEQQDTVQAFIDLTKISSGKDSNVLYNYYVLINNRVSKINFFKKNYYNDYLDLKTLHIPLNVFTRANASKPINFYQCIGAIDF
jgi:hypothetical protein